MLNARKEKALQALLTTNSITAAAEKANLSPRTIYSYLHNDDEFAAAYAQAKAALVDEATTRLKKNLAPAIDILRQIADDENVPPGVRVSACRTLLDNSLKMVEVNEILQRLDALEQATEDET